MDEQGASRKTQMEKKDLWNVERGMGHLGGIQECCQSMQGWKEVGYGPTGIKSGKGCQRQQEELLQVPQ